MTPPPKTDDKKQVQPQKDQQSTTPAPQAKPVLEVKHAKPKSQSPPNPKFSAPSGFKFLVFYPLLLCSWLFFFIVPREIILKHSFLRTLNGDIKISHEIMVEPKLADRWLTGSVLKPKTTTNFLDETNFRRHLVTMMAGDESITFVISYLYNVMKHKSDEYNELDAGFYIGGPFFDMNVQVTMKSFEIKRFTYMQANFTTSSVEPLYRAALWLAPIGHEMYLAECLKLLMAEIATQYGKKMELLRDFALEEDMEALEAAKEAEKKQQALPDDNYKDLYNS